MTAATPGARAVRRAERAFDRLFGLRANPLRQLGALAFWLLWIVVASGFWIYVLYETSVAGAWASVDAMRLQPWGAGLMRSLHRYASDALVVVTTLHALREWLLGRHRGTRWFAWVSGVPLLWLLPASGIVGYWMVWDRRAQYAGTALLEWATTLPGVALESVRNLLDPAAVTDRFFSLLSFLHIGAPLLLLLGSWVHLLRLKDPLTQPRPALAWGSLVTLVAGSLALPALSMPVADLARVPSPVDIDWFFLAALPAADWWPLATWGLLTAGTLLLTALPWLGRTPAGAAVVVHGHRKRWNMPKPLRLAGQAVLYAAFAAFIGYFASAPAYSLLAPGQGLLRLSFSHPGKIVSDCRKRSAEELAKLPPQMRTADDCQRGRSPVSVRIVVDGRTLLDRSFAPAGLSHDGASSGYWRAPLAAGPHRLQVSFRDDLRAEAPVYERDTTLTVAEGQIVLIDFRADGPSIR